MSLSMGSGGVGGRSWSSAGPRCLHLATVRS